MMNVKNIFFAAVVVVCSIVGAVDAFAQESMVADSQLRQLLAEEWRKEIEPGLLAKGLQKEEIALPRFPVMAPSQIRRMSAADFRKQEGQEFPIDTVLYSGKKAINLVLMGDGFTSDEYPKFKQCADNMVNALFTQLPYKDYKAYFNIFYIKVDSKESGASHPGYPAGSGCPEGSSLPIKNVDTYFGCAFDCYGIHRLIVVTNNKPYELLKAIIPDYDVVGILSNTTEYGGSGGDLLVTTINSASNEIFIHEMGHTFGKLADEYFAGDFYLGEAPNTSKYNTEETVPWKAWWGRYQVGAYPIGGSAKGNSYYKPVNGICKMEYLGKQFCPPCRENIIKEIHKHTNMIASYLPSAVTVKPAYETETVDFEVEYYDVPRRIKIQWVLDDVEVANDESKYTLDVSGFAVNERHTLTVNVIDKSPYLAEPISCNKTWYVRRQESTGIEVVEANGSVVKVESMEGGLYITTPDYRQVIIYGADGQRVCSRHIAGAETIELPAGIYIVEGNKYLVK